MRRKLVQEESEFSAREVLHQAAGRVDRTLMEDNYQLDKEVIVVEHPIDSELLVVKCPKSSFTTMIGHWWQWLERYGRYLPSSRLWNVIGTS